MSVSYNWSIADLNRKTEDGFVFTVHWRVNASNESYSEGAYGSIPLERPEELIPFDQLSPELVVQWVKDYFGEEKVAEIEATLAARLIEKQTPTQVSGVPSSWVSSEPSAPEVPEIVAPVPGD